MARGSSSRVSGSSAAGSARQPWLCRVTCRGSGLGARARDSGFAEPDGSLRFGPDGAMYIAVGSPDGDSGQILRFLADGRIPAESPGASPVYWSIDSMPAGIDWQPGDASLWTIETSRTVDRFEMRRAWRGRRHCDHSAATWHCERLAPRTARHAGFGTGDRQRPGKPVRRRRDRLVDRPRRSAALRRQPRRPAGRRSRAIAARPVRRDWRRDHHVVRRHLFLHPEQRHLGRRPRCAGEAAADTLIVASRVAVRTRPGSIARRRRVAGRVEAVRES